MSENQQTIAFFPEPGAWGPTNNCVAVAEVLRGRGIRTVFVVEDSFKGVLAERGFEEALFRVAPATGEAETVGGGWAEWVRDNAKNFRRPTQEQITTVIKPIWEELVAHGKFAHERLTEIFEHEVRPDLIVSDNVCAFPAVYAGGRPWVRAVSANPLELRDPTLPPPLSGLSISDGTNWQQFRDRARSELHPAWSELNDFCRSVGLDSLPDEEFQYVSPLLNYYLFPGEVDYVRSRPLGDTWHRLDSTVRTSDRLFDVAEHLPGEGKVIYLSLGSLGSMDTALMQRLIDILAGTEHRVVVSMGPLHHELRLGERMYGEGFLPQTSILNQCDLLITHGGNNTFAEAFYFGLPTIVLPLFWDQYDNAQRAQETGFGVRLQTYDFEDHEMLDAVERLLANTAMNERIRTVSAQMQAQPGRIKGADLLEQVVHRLRA